MTRRTYTPRNRTGDLWTFEDAFTVGYETARRGERCTPPGETGTVWFDAYVDGYERATNA